MGYDPTNTAAIFELFVQWHASHAHRYNGCPPLLVRRARRQAERGQGQQEAPRGLRRGRQSHREVRAQGDRGAGRDHVQR